jgi:hypothetical protein
MRQRNYLVRNLLFALGAVVLAAVLFDAGMQAQSSPPPVPSKPPSVQIRNTYGNLPLSFEENRGQTDPRVKFLARGGGYSLFLTSTEAVLKLRASSSASANRPTAGKIAPTGLHTEAVKMSVVQIHLEGANPASQASGVERLPGVSNYFIGKDPKKWRKNVPTFAGVKFAGIYPGIDLVYRGAQGRLEYDYIVAPNADPSRIRMSIDGADELKLDRAGDLIIKTSGGVIVEKAPIIYQGADATRHPVKGGYVLIGKNRVAFKLGSYDRSQPLTIDPLLTYFTFLGGTGNGEFGDVGIAIAADSAGEAIVVGNTYSADFPTQDAFQTDLFGQSDVFITKFSADGSSLIYSTYAGGSASDLASGIALDPQGDAYVTGTTNSPDYPVSIGAYQTFFVRDPSTDRETFVTAVDPDGGLIYSTLINQYAGEGISVDSSGDAYIACESFAT